MYTIKALYSIQTSLLTELTARYIIHLESEGIRMDKLSVKKPEHTPGAITDLFQMNTLK